MATLAGVSFAADQAAQPSSVKKAKAALEKATAEKATAEKALAKKVAAERAAIEKLAAEQAYAARMSVRKAVAEKLAAEKELVKKAAAARKAATAQKTAQKTAAQTAAEKANAEKEIAERADAEKAAAGKTAAEKDADKKTALERAAAEKAVAQKSAAAKTAAEKAGAAKAAAEKAAAEKVAAENVVARTAAAVAAAIGEAAVAESAAMGGLKPLPANKWDYAKARHLLFRAGFGGPPEEIEKLRGMGLHAAVDHLVEYHKQPPCTILFDVAPPERPLGYESRLEPKERSQLNSERTQRERRQQAQLREWWLRRMVETPRPLQEKLTLFWHDHFAVNYKTFYFTHILYKQNELFRGRAGDNFGALLRGIVHDAAMIRFLDNHVNFKNRGNENLGREILELFSLGEGRGYTEEDLRQASRALTGYSYDHFSGQFRFVATRHDETGKTIFGRKGNWGGDDLVDLVLRQPQTAQYVSKKLFEFFAHENPGEETNNRLAAVLRGNQYELAPMLKNLFLSEEFYSQQTMASHIKSPVELLVGTIRVLGIKGHNYGAVDRAIQNMGLTLFEPPNVAGWEEGRAWVNASRILLRYNGVAKLVEQPNLDVVASLEGKALKTPADVVDYLTRRCLVMPLNQEKRKDLIEFLGSLPPNSEWTKQRNQLNAKLRALLVLIMSMPEYQVS